MRAMILCLVASATAHAEPLALRPGEVAAQVVVEANLASGEFAAPLSLAPDVWWGASARWTLGVIHSDPAVDIFRPGASLCLRGCSHVYRGGGFDARWLANDHVALRARVLDRDVDPWKPAMTLGALARWSRGMFMVTGDPYLQIGLANRDQGNRAQLVLPVELDARFAGRWQAELRTGYTSELVNWSDGYHVPLWLGGRVDASERISIGAAVGFYSLLGPQGTPKQRALFITLGWR